MMFYINPSYSGSHRIFVQLDAQPEVHAALKKLSMWGGHDKTEVLLGTTYLGYEITNNKIGVAVEKIIFITTEVNPSV